MLKFILFVLLQSPFLTFYYLNPTEPLWLIINQLVLTLFIVLMDNAISVNLKNINALNINFEELLKGITKIATKKEVNLEEKWFDELK